MRILLPALALVAATQISAQCPNYSSGNISAGLARVGGGEDARLVYVDCLPSIGVVYAKFGAPGGSSTLDGLPLTIAILDDPTNDMDPTDAVLITEVTISGGVTGAHTGVWQKYDLHALTGSVVATTGGTWIAVGVNYPAGISPGPGSIEFVSNAPGTQWLATDQGGGINYAALSQNTQLVDVQTGPGFPPGTWAILVESGADNRPFGTGCAGSNGVPTLSATPSFSPIPGQLQVFDVTNLPVPPALAAWVLGFARFDPAPDLGTFAGGAPTGCSLLVDPTSWDFLSSVGGAAGFVLSIPNDPSLTGLSAFTQVLAIDAGANPMGVTVSNGLQTVVGY